MRFVGGVVGGVIGSAFGFPQLGYAIGSLIGGSFEKQSTIKNTGPRLDDLSGPTSNIIGRQIPIVYGTDRISLSIIWTSSKKEKKHTKKESSGGKGGGGQTVKTTTYTYSISFAAAICEGEILGIRRIWINKTIVYDLDQGTISDPELNFKLYLGTEDQLPDSTMEGYLGAGNVPAYRGLAYIVFKNLQLEKYGNQIPVNIEVEVVRSGVLASTVTKLYESQALYTSNVDDCHTANFIVQSPNTGIIWTSPNTSSNSANVLGTPIAYGFDTGGNVVATLVPDKSEWSSGLPSTGHLGPIGAFTNVIGELIFMTYEFWYDDTYSTEKLYLGIALYNEEGTVVYRWDNIIQVDAGSFLDARNYYAKGLMDGVSYITNLTNASISWIRLFCPRSYLVINLDGSYSIAYQVSSVVFTESDIPDVIVVDNPDYQNQGDNGRIIAYLYKSDYGMRIYEDDYYNLKTKAIGLLNNSTNNNFGRSDINVYKPDPDLPAVDSDNTKINISIAEFQGIPGTLGTIIRSTAYCVSEVILNDGDSYCFVTTQTSTSANSFWLLAFYKQSTDTNYTYVDYETSDVGLELKYFSPVLDRDSGDIIFFTYRGTDRLITFNIYDRSWGSSNLPNWPGGDYPHSNMTFKPNSSPYVYFAREIGSKHNLYRLAAYTPNKTGTTLETIVTDIASRASIDISDLDTTNIASLPVKGYSIRNHYSAKSNISAILPMHLVDPVESEWKLKFEPFKTTSISIYQNDLGAVKIGDEVEDKYTLEKRELDEIPKGLALHYSGFENTYLKTQQSAVRNGFIYNHDNSDIVEIPAVMEDNFAAQLVEKMLYILWISATTFKISLPIKYAYLEPTDIINFYISNGTENFVGKITSIDRESNSILEISGEKYLTESITSYAIGALNDTNNVQSIPVISFMYVQPIDFRPLYEVDNITKQYNSIYIVGSGYSNNWSAGEVFYSTDGVDFSELTYITNSVIFGKLNNDMPAVNNPLIMQYNTNIDITILGTKTVESITLEEMKQGKNTMLILSNTGTVLEVIQFMTATQQTANNRYLLSNIWRNRYNTYNYTTATQGSRILVVDDTTLKQINISGDYIGKQLYLKGVSVGQYEVNVSPKTYTYNGVWSGCPRPVHLKATEVTSGNIRLDWHAIRRFKTATMFSDATIYHSEEKFKVEVYNFAGTLVTSFSDITAKTYTYVLDNGFTQGDYMTFRVYQYSDIHLYNTEYSEVTICTDYDALIGTLTGNIFGYYRFNENHDSTTLIDYSGNNDHLIGTGLPAVMPAKGIEIINKKNGGFRQGQGKYVGSFDNPTSNYASYCFWIILDKKPSSEHTIISWDGNATYGEHSITISTGGILQCKQGGSSWATKTLTLGRLYHVAYCVDHVSNTWRLYIDNVVHSTSGVSSFEYQLDGIFQLGSTVSTGIIYTLDELIYFKQYISAADVNILYKAGLSQLGDRAKWQPQI